jgi:hypothetical protein
MTTTRTPTLDEVLNAYCKFAVRPRYKDSRSKKRQELIVHNFVLNLRRDGADNDHIYDRLAEMNPLLGCPLTFYQEIVLPFDDVSKAAEAAQKKVSKEASDAALRATSEFSNKRKCIELEHTMRKKQTKSSELTTARPVLAARGIKQIGVGSYVEVEEDLTVHVCSYGGFGFVKATVGDGAQRTFAVKYTGEARRESGIKYWRVTERVPYGVGRPVRDRQCPLDLGKENIDESLPRPRLSESTRVGERGRRVRGLPSSLSGG